MAIQAIDPSGLSRNVHCDNDGALLTAPAVGGGGTSGGPTPALTNVNDSAANVTLLAANSERVGVILYNDSTQSLFLKYGATASATSFTVIIEAGGYWEMPTPIYRGIIDGIWAADAAGAARITELT